MVLTSTAPVWFDASRAPSTRSTAWPAGPVDVAVVGGGLAGLCTALRCAEAGASVVVLEARHVAAGTTGGSTAKVTALHGLTYASLRRGKGAEGAARYAAANAEAVVRLRELADGFADRAGWVDETAYTCAGTRRGVPAIDREAEAAREAGLDVSVVDTTELPLEVHRAVALGRQGRVDPVQLAAGIADELVRLGATVVEGARVTAVEEQADGCTVRGEGDQVLRADVVVQATHLPVVDPAFLAARVRPERSYVVAGPPRSGEVPAGMYIAHDVGWSVRAASVGGDEVLLVGGESHPMVRSDAPSERLARLDAFAREQLAVEVSHRWSAFDYTTTDGVPFIGRLAPGSERRYVATGFRKWGMSTSMVAATVLSELIAGRPDPYGGLFDASRLLPTVSKDLVRNNAQVSRRFLGDRVRAFRRGAEQLPSAGDGTILRRHGTDVAVARTVSGELKAVKAACTHLGCLVAHNAADQSWDCPCHGSRFDLDGNVLEGPASTPLQRADLDDA